jgi:hypothetical protein
LKEQGGRRHSACAEFYFGGHKANSPRIKKMELRTPIRKCKAHLQAWRISKFIDNAGT